MQMEIDIKIDLKNNHQNVKKIDYLQIGYYQLL